MLSLRDPFTITTGFNRDNLYFEVDKPPDKMAAPAAIPAGQSGKSGIVYCTTRKTVEEVCQKLRTAGFPATRYHAGLSPEERRDNQEDFLYDRAPLMVATNAFGMGIDKSNVAFVLHYNMPGSMEAYYQEAGRAGRDGQPAQCILYYSGQDVATNRFLIEHGEGAPDADEETTARLREQDKERLKQMTFYCHTADCLREYILRYFGETPENYCGNCGNCSRNFEEADVTREAQLLVEGIARTGQRFGAKMVLDILRGSGNARILSGGFDKLPVYGKLAGVGEKRLRAILQFLELRGFVESTGDEYPVLRLRETAEDLMREDAALTMKIAREEVPARKSRKPVPANPGLFDALRALRAKLAAAQSVPAYVVFSDATLRDMCAVCRRRPTRCWRYPVWGRRSSPNTARRFSGPYGTIRIKTGYRFRRERHADLHRCRRLPGGGQHPAAGRRPQGGDGDSLRHLPRDSAAGGADGDGFQGGGQRGFRPGQPAGPGGCGDYAGLRSGGYVPG